MLYSIKNSVKDNRMTTNEELLNNHIDDLIYYKAKHIDGFLQLPIYLLDQEDIAKAVAKIDEKIRNQIDHIFNLHSPEMLKQKVNDLVFEWYLKGFTAATESVKRSFGEK